MSKSQNGWPASKSLATRVINPVPGIHLRIADNDYVEILFTYLVQQYNKRIEPIAKVADDWGFAFRANVNSPNELSNHASGTALDLNAEQHPNGVGTGKTFSQKEINEVHKILDELGGAVRWGGDYHHTIDAMHFEINTLPGSSLLKKAANAIHALTVTPKPAPPTKKSVDQIAAEVIAGKWGNGDERIQKLTAAGYNPIEVQAKVNVLLK